VSNGTPRRARGDEPAVAAKTPWDASWHLRAELARVLDALARCLRGQRERGRTPAGDAVRGLVIEEGEAEGLIAELASAFGDAVHPAEGPSPRSARDEIAERADRASAQGASLPLRHARLAFELLPHEYDALLLALAVEVDARFGRIVAYLNDHVGHSRPTLGLALALAGLDSNRPVSAVGVTDRPFIRDGLIELEGDLPLPGVTLKVPADLIGRLAGRPDSTPEHAWLSLQLREPDLLGRLVLEESALHQLTIWSDSLLAGWQTPPLLVAGAVGSGRATSARAALFRAGLHVVCVDISAETADRRLLAARREARWHAAAMVVRSVASPQPLDWSSIWRTVGADRPAAIIALPEEMGAAAAAAPVEPAALQLDEPGVPLRLRLWPALLPDGVRYEESEVAELATRFSFGPGRIARSIRRATADLCLRPPGERRLDYPSLLAAARAVDSATVGPLAQKMALPYERHELVVPPQVAAELDLALAWVRHRHRVLHEWGFVRRVAMGHGLTALFSGPSGTGKTMAAQVLARELGLDLYRIDLSQIMSKYIGDTEKNLALVFGARVGILFFDEAEAVLGKRSEVKTAHDRYANIEIGYLLQRMEEYDGVTILATNRMQDIDDAFVRRLHVVVDFPMPSEADRLRIWQGMLPADAERAPDLELRALAREFDLSGGQIKNAALAGAYLAAAEKEPIGMDHLRRAARRELLKSGKIVDNGE
jgi:hypothetical protein